MVVLNSKRFRPCHFEQGELLPTYPSDLVSENHPARLISEVVEGLDLSALYAKYSWEGGEAIHPKILLQVLFYAYSDGVCSSRQIAKHCRENIVYLYISGQNKPNFRTISDFRKNNLGLLAGLFNQIVNLCYRLGMVRLGKISLDGTKIKANASKRNNRTQDDLEKELVHLEEEIQDYLTNSAKIDQQEDRELGSDQSGDELPSTLQKKQQRQEKIKELIQTIKDNDLKKINITDPDARQMKSHGRIEASYNGQCATENQVIVAYDLNNQETDRDQLAPMVQQLEERARDLHQSEDEAFPLQETSLITDSGYDSGKNLKHLVERKIDGYVADPMSRERAKEHRGEKEAKPYSKDKFQYNATDDSYACPQEQQLVPLRRTSVKKKSYQREEVVYQGTTCHQCQAQKECTTSKAGYRQIRRFIDYDPYREAMNKKSRTDIGRAMSRHRATDVEPVFAQLKHNIAGGKGFLLRGIQKNKGEFGLWALTHNLKKIVRHISTLNNKKDINFARLQLRMG